MHNPGAGRQLYFAYGSNLAKNRLSQRCPSAGLVRPFELPGWRLVFRCTADIEQSIGHTFVGAFYSVTQADVLVVDQYESVHHGRYRRKYLRVRGIEFLTQVMNNDLPEKPPSPAYLALIEQGYRDWRLPMRSLAPDFE